MARFSSLMLAALLAALPLQAAHSAQFVLVNKSGRSIDAFYMAPCWARNWGNNQVAWTPVWTSKTFTIKDIAPGCYNLMIMLPFGNKCVISGELIEGIKSWTITPWTTVRAATDDCSHIAHPVSAGERSHDRRDFIPMPALQ